MCPSGHTSWRERCIGFTTPRPDLNRELVEEYQEQIGIFKENLMEVLHHILTLKEEDSCPACQKSAVSKTILGTNVQVRRLLCVPAVAELSSGRKDSIELPRIDIPTFKGNIMEWRLFWEQYKVSAHSKPHLSNPKKLAYW